MRTPTAALVVILTLSGTGFAAEPQSCEIPGYLLFGNNELKRVEAAVTKQRRLTIAVVGTGSSMLAGPEGRPSAYPARLEAALKKRLPNVAIKVETLVRSRMTAEDMARDMGKLLIDEKPDLVIWQTGTFDAIRRVDPDIFRVALGPYADGMRVVAQQNEAPLFDRLAIMRHWSDTGAFDLYAAGKDNVLAHRVHDCIGRGLASTIIEAAHLKAVEHKAGQ